ncbi:xanthine dehydrogenase family protein molybdopterin-binding subunit [Intestinibacter bartlettii]|uniref:xanthine dehydrogenase family protein molybdopterin-binding subunit n=1 Tax=Intestinibacter bartlettii TaxID=261299 RepID=UPI0028FEF9A2|nr:molybdopterin cofactor-binding domain-containing protein [Intestinibacter bartlettii]MDU2162240.1 molybdopterin cofactor-binding domain-containing protein [Intestinibacter bartlettii]
MKFVNNRVMKKDAMSLVTGQAVYTDDIAPKDALIVKVLRSPHAHALVKNVKKDVALKVPGIECILTWEDAPKTRFTTAGQTYPELSPYDRKILDERVRYVGDAVAIVAGENEKCVDRALKMIKVEYEVLKPVLDFREALDNEVVVHPEEDWEVKVPISPDVKRNLICHDVLEEGDVEAEFAKCKYVIEETYLTKANQQTMMETFRAYTYKDAYGRLVCVASTQVPFHVRRILATALDTSKSNIRVVKPRIGGGFGAKQSVINEIFPALVTWKTGKPAKIIYSRKESQIVSSPRHQMQITVKLGADENGKLKAASLYTLSNAGAFGDHTPTTIGLTGHKSLPLYTSHVNAFKFAFDGVYSNTIPAGAYRGYGATQGVYALETTMNKLALKMNMDPIEFKKKNLLKEGDYMPAYHGETANSCTLEKCLDKVKEMINWDEKYPCKDLGNGKVRSVGLAVAMQGSAISNVDVASVTIKVNDDGFYSMMIGATDMGTGCDTILAQIAADCLDTHVDNIVVYGVDTDISPYDSGSYASSTTYLTGNATIKTCQILREKIIAAGADMLDIKLEDADFDGEKVYSVKEERSISLKDIANNAMCYSNHTLTATAKEKTPVSPPPYMAGAVEIELDKETGHVEIIDYATCVDCGTVINPALATVQTEGGLVQGIGMALYEDVQYDNKGRILNDSFMQYKIPTRLDMGKIRVEFESSYEPTGPFGAKSIGELVINTPSPALCHAIYNASGVWINELPMTSEKIAMGILKNNIEA